MTTVAAITTDVIDPIVTSKLIDLSASNAILPMYIEPYRPVVGAPLATSLFPEPKTRGSSI